MKTIDLSLECDIRNKNIVAYNKIMVHEGTKAKRKARYMSKSSIMKR